MLNSSPNLLTLIVGIGSGIVGIAVGAFLNYRFSRKLEAFKWLHKERAQVLVELYRFTSNVHYACIAMAEVPAIEKYLPKAEREKLRKDSSSRALEKAYEFFEYADSNEALLPQKLVRQIRDLHAKYLHLIATDIGRSVDGILAEQEKKLIKDMAADIAPLREEVQRKIQKSLGVK